VSTLSIDDLGRRTCNEQPPYWFSASGDLNPPLGGRLGFESELGFLLRRTGISVNDEARDADEAGALGPRIITIINRETIDAPWNGLTSVCSVPL
jgi:hypothetical protein